jgi:hypothetical protein
VGKARRFDDFLAFLLSGRKHGALSRLNALIGIFFVFLSRLTFAREKVDLLFFSSVGGRKKRWGNSGAFAR